MNMVVFRRCQSALGVAAVMALALVASLVFVAMPAAAVTLSRADAGTFLRYEHGGEQVIGVMAKDSTNNYYCIEADERVEYQLGGERQAARRRHRAPARLADGPLSRRDGRGACGNRGAGP